VARNTTNDKIDDFFGTNNKSNSPVKEARATETTGGNTIANDLLDVFSAPAGQTEGTPGGAQ